jgi:hypothetical protein
LDGGRRRLTGGSGLSAGEEYCFGGKVSGPRARFSAGPNRFPLALIYIFFLFYFLISFITSLNLVQIDLNQFINFSKNSEEQTRAVRNIIS